MDVFVARQPIFDSRTSVYAYELLFRSGTENVFSSSDPDAASAQVMSDSSSLFGLDSLTAGRRAFVNVTPRILTDSSRSVRCDFPYKRRLRYTVFRIL